MIKKVLQSGCLSFFIILVFSTLLHAGAWSAKKNTLYNKLSFNYYTADKSFSSSGKRVSSYQNGEFVDYNLNNYLEYGIIDCLTAISSLTFKYITNDTDEVYSRAYGFGDVDIAMKYMPMDNIAGVLSFQVLGKFPGSYGKDDPLPLGNAQIDLEFKVLYGRSMYPLIPGYFNLEAGYRIRFEEPSDEFRYLIEIGFDIYKGLYGRAKLDAIQTIDNGSSEDLSGNPTNTYNYNLGKLEIALGYKISEFWGIEVSCTPAVYGNDTAAGIGCSVGVFVKTDGLTNKSEKSITPGTSSEEKKDI